MKKVFALLFTTCILLQTFAVGIVTPPKNAKDFFIPIGTTGQQISLMELSQLDVKSFETLSGKHLGFMDRMGFKLAQRDLRKSINEDGTINSKKLTRFMKRVQDHSTGFHIGGFALGFFVGLIGVLIAYLINDDNKPNRTKWAWIGFGIYVVLILALYAAMI
jgi:hypothetical protein